MTALRRLLTFGLLLLSLCLPRFAHAADGASPIAPDVPLIAHGDPIVLPPVPASYEVQRLGWWTIEYPAAVRDRVRPIIEKADEWKAQLVRDFGQEVLAQPIDVRIARTWEDMTTLVPRELGVIPYASGETYMPTRLVLVSLTEPSGGASTDVETVFHHELSHVALYDALAGRHVPLWFNEGLAIHESGEHPVQRMKELWDATLFRQLLPLSDLDRGFPQRQDEVNIAYAESADVVRFLLRGKDHLRFVSLLERVRRSSVRSCAGGRVRDGRPQARVPVARGVREAEHVRADAGERVVRLGARVRRAGARLPSSPPRHAGDAGSLGEGRAAGGGGAQGRDGRGGRVAVHRSGACSRGASEDRA
jgi:hypothetical protein